MAKKLILKKTKSNEKNTQKEILSKQSKGNIDDVVSQGKNTSKIPIGKDEEEVIKELVSELKVNKDYRRMASELKEEETEEKEAIKQGFNPDNYYSAKQKEDEENEIEMTDSGHSGSFSNSGSSR